MKIKKIISGICMWLFLWCAVSNCLRAENIDPAEAGSQYAWGENVGWLNAEPSGQDGPGLTVTSTEVTGYLWAENIGWISLSCQNTGTCAAVSYGVVNDGNGTLSGYAWGENVGWISLSCRNTMSCESVDYGVVIDSATGHFSGHAWGENIGWVTFDSISLFDYGIVTSWSGSGCLADIEPDGDVDGVDLADYADRYGLSGAVDLSQFALEFGTFCGF